MDVINTKIIMYLSSMLFTLAARPDVKVEVDGVMDSK